MFQMLSKAYSDLLINKESCSAGAIAQQANFWDPPSKSSDGDDESSKDDPIQSLIR